MKITAEGKLRRVIGKMNIMIESIDWGDAGLRSNEVSVASEHLRSALREMENTFAFQRGIVDDEKFWSCPEKQC